VVAGVVATQAVVVTVMAMTVATEAVTKEKVIQEVLTADSDLVDMTTKIAVDTVDVAAVPSVAVVPSAVVVPSAAVTLAVVLGATATTDDSQS